MLVWAVAVFIAVCLTSLKLILTSRLEDEQHFVINQGESISLIIARLYEEGIINHPKLMKLSVRMFAPGKTFKAGEYKFTPDQSQIGVVESIINGSNLLHFFTIIEGEQSYSVLERLKSEPCLEGELDGALVEGSMLADSYGFFCHTNRAQLVKLMQASLQEYLMQAWPKHNMPINLTPSEVVTLASIVEQESTTFEEQPLIASVYFNRLKIGMKLQADPTTIYALTEGKQALGRLLTKKDLKVASLYNTYHVAGLPPSPIANVSRFAINAVLNPAESDYLYFVHDGGKRHVFARDYPTHLNNVAKVRAARKKTS